MQSVEREGTEQQHAARAAGISSERGQGMRSGAFPAAPGNARGKSRRCGAGRHRVPLPAPAHLGAPANSGAGHGQRGETAAR